MRRVLVACYDVCTGCRTCELVCSYEKEHGYNPRFARLHIVTSRDGLWNDVIVCAQCENPACLRVCPPKAIKRDDALGVILVDPERCSGCGLCTSYCHRQIIKLYPAAEGSKAYKCDLCGGRAPCVAACPTAALHLVELEGQNAVRLS
jgi:carbon-monoxide dehydrogenase iron sulfur subunit